MATQLADETQDLAAQIPPRILAGLRLYALEHRETGGFLGAVLANDLTEAICRADEDSLAAIESIVKYVYNCLPSACHGSREKVKAWIAAGGEG